MFRMKSRRNIVGENIRKLRAQTGFTQEELALQSGLSQGYINQLEHGKRNYTQKSLEQIATALTAPLKAFFEDESKGTVVTGEPPATYQKKRVNKKEFFALLNDLPEQIADHYFTILKLEKELSKNNRFK